MIPREIHIRSVLNGFVVQVGCQQIVFTSRDELVSELREYLKHPQYVEQFYRENACNKAMLSEPVSACPPPPMRHAPEPVEPCAASNMPATERRGL